ncbi:MAG TPA: hypothetical protein DCZ61_06425 [Lachnospiraceae bacterium]|nr:hypothetical protein [Lachnospiraceae bacterium]
MEQFLYRRVGPDKHVAVIRFCIIALCSIIGISFLLLYHNSRYELPGDYFRSLLLSGAVGGNGDGRYFRAFPFSGQFLVRLYTLKPSVNWYFWLLILMGTISLLVLFFIFCSQLNGFAAYTVSALFFIIFARDCFLLPDSERIAVMALCSGCIIFFWCLRERRALLLCAAGLVLIAASLLFFGRPAFTAIPFAAVFLLVMIISILETRSMIYGAVGKIDYGKGRKAGGLLLLLLPVVILSAGAVFANHFAESRQTDLEWRSYNAYLSIRSKLYSEVPLPEYEQIETQLTAIGISRGDYAMLAGEMDADPDVFNAAALAKVRDVVENYRKLAVPSIRDILILIRDREYWLYPGALLTIALSLFVIIFYRKRFWLPILLNIGALAIFGVCAAAGQLSYRLESAVFFCCCAVLAASCTPAAHTRFGYRKSRSEITPEALNTVPGTPWYSILWRILAVVLAAVLLIFELPAYLPVKAEDSLSMEDFRLFAEKPFLTSGNYDIMKYRMQTGNRTVHPGFAALTAENPDTLYLLDPETVPETLSLDNSPWEVPKAVSGANRIVLSGFTLYHPASQKALAERDIENPIASLLTENVYFVTASDGTRMLEYLQTHYDPDASKELAALVDGYFIWNYLPGRK